jgi:uncharacterized RDD family membrane protein YckC
VILIALKGATLGKMAVGIRVVRVVDGQVPGWGPSFARWGMAIGIGIVTCGLGTLLVDISPFFDSSGNNQGWHDKVAKTVVIRS